MTCNKRVYYFKLNEIFDDSVPFGKLQLQDFLLNLYNYETVSDLVAQIQLPSDFITNKTIYDEFASLVWGRYYDEYFIRIDLLPNETLDNDMINEAIINWGYRFVSLLNMTYEYYMPLINFYRSAKANLMDDITATSTNTVKFNDTPQNANTGGAYEGDDYLTHFTKTSNTSSSPLESKINRLKEIQDNYKNVMADWVKEFEKLFMENV